MKLESFLQKCREDGVMTIDDLRRLAKSMGVDNTENLYKEADLIRKIQVACGHRPCFRLERKLVCEDANCNWIKECQKLIAVWQR